MPVEAPDSGAAVDGRNQELLDGGLREKGNVCDEEIYLESPLEHACGCAIGTSARIPRVDSRTLRHAVGAQKRCPLGLVTETVPRAPSEVHSRSLSSAARQKLPLSRSGSRASVPCHEGRASQCSPACRTGPNQARAEVANFLYRAARPRRSGSLSGARGAPLATGFRRGMRRHLPHVPDCSE
eukprot:2705027-Prymnesium_polylepis.1